MPLKPSKVEQLKKVYIVPIKENITNQYQAVS